MYQMVDVISGLSENEYTPIPSLNFQTEDTINRGR